MREHWRSGVFLTLVALLFLTLVLGGGLLLGVLVRALGWPAWSSVVMAVVGSLATWWAVTGVVTAWLEIMDREDGGG